MMLISKMASKKRIKLDNRQKSLFSCGVSHKSGREPDQITTEDKTQPETEEKGPKKKEIRSFHHEWLGTYKWLRFQDGKMTCALCVAAKKDNVFTKGCSRFKTSSMLDHIRTHDHQMSLAVPNLIEDRERVVKKMFSQKEHAVVVALKSVLWMARENIPLSKFSSFIQFQRSVGVDLSALAVSPGVSYESDYSVHEFLQALSDVIEEDTVNSLKDSPCVTVLCDESTDRTVTHRLVIYCQIINPTTMQPETRYITNIELPGGTGAAISSALYEEMGKRGVTPDKITGLGTDGASAMTGNYI